jgi:hypothetical protein
MPTITVSVANNTEIRPQIFTQIFENAVLILGKNRNFIKNELQKNINVFKTRVFTDVSFLKSPENSEMRRVIIIAGDDRAGAIETAIYFKAAKIPAVIITEKPIYGANKYAEAIITAENAELAECTAAALSAKTLSGALTYIYGVGETARSAAAQVFSKLPAAFSDMKIYTNADFEQAGELFSFVSDNFEILSAPDDFDGVWINAFLG